MLGVAQRVLQRGPAAATAPALIGAWSFDETSGTTAIDEAGDSDGSYTNVALQQDSLVAGDPGSSVRFFGNSAVAVPHAAAYEVGSYSVVVYAEVQSGPGPGANAQLLQKDRGGLPGGFQIAVCDDGATLRPQVYTKDASGSAIWVGSAEGVGQVVLGTAFMLVMTCGGNGTRVYLDKVLIGSTNNHVALSENNEQIGIGRYRPGIIDTAGFNGWIDEVRFYVGELTLEEIDALADAQDLIPDEPEPPEEINFVLPRVPSAPTGTTIRYVAGVGAHGGTGSNSNSGSVGSPWLTIAHAIANTSNSTNTTIVIRSGATYREANLSPGSRKLTGFYADIAIDPLDPANWAWISGEQNNPTWELVDSGPQEYRTTATNIAGGSGTPQGMAISGTSWQIPSYWPLAGEVNPTPPWRLYPYQGTTGARSRQAFRHTGAVSLNQNAGYNGPGLYRESDGRIHIRLQPVDPSYYGGEASDKIANRVPSDNTIILWGIDRQCFSSLGSGSVIEGLGFKGFDRITQTAVPANGAFRGNVVLGFHFQNAGLRLLSGTGDYVIEDNIVVGGLPDAFSWHLCKNITANGSNNYGRLTFIASQSNGQMSLRITNNMIIGVFDVLIGGTSNHADSIFEIDRNYVQVRDDLQQLTTKIRRLNIHHNIIIGPSYGHDSGNSPADPVEWFFHHNICLCHQMYLNQVGERTGHPVFAFHGSVHDAPKKIYHNLIVATQPCREPRGANILLPDYNQNSARINYTFNNILMWYPRVPPGGSAPGDKWLSRRHRAHDDNYRFVMDGNAYHGQLGPGVGGSLMLWASIWSAGTSNAQDFANLAAWKASVKYTATVGRNGYAAGWDTNSIQADPVLVGDTAGMLDGDPRGRPVGDWRPTANAYQTGAVDITSFGWPGASPYQPWRGPSNSDGQWTDIGPQGQATALLFAPESFGAVGNGVADDRAAIMAACDAAAASSPKGTVWLGSGKTYRVVQTGFTTSSTMIPVLPLTSTHDGITIASNPSNRATIKLRDDPPGGGTLAERGTPVIGATGCTGVIFRDFIIDGSRTAYYDEDNGGTAENGGMHGIRFMGGSGNKVLGKMSIIRCHADAIALRGNVADTLIDGESPDNLLLDENRRLGIGFIQCDGVIVRNVKIDRTGLHIGANEGQIPRSALWSEPNNNNVCEDILIEGFTIDRSGARGIGLDCRTSGRGCIDWLIRNGVIINSAQNSSNESIRLRPTVDDASLFSGITIDNVTCDNRLLIGGAGTGSIGDGTYGSADDLTITGCALASGVQIACQHCAGDGWLITGNTKGGSSSDVASETNLSLTNSTVQP